MLPSVNLIVREHEYGLRHSRELAAAILERYGFRVRALTAEIASEPPRRPSGRRGPGFRDLNLFMETLYPEAFPLARRQILIPNQEWFFERNLPDLAQVDAVISKTRHAQAIFSKLGCRTVYTGFTSRDRKQLVSEGMQREFLCLNAKRASVARRVLAVWRRHPHWPRLTITSDTEIAEVRAPNVRHIRGFLSDEDVLRLQNTCRFHLCVTRAEGFGHKLNEGMSCGAIVVATDGPPMNELIAPDRGMLVRAAGSEPAGLGTAYDFDEADLEAAVERCASMPAAEIEALSRRARAWFEENDLRFRAAFPEIVRALA